MALYRGWDFNEVMKGGSSQGDATSFDPPSLGFTPINRPQPGQPSLPTPAQTATGNEGRSGTTARKHHPAVVEYLHLGAERDAPSQFDRPAPPPPEKTNNRKRPRASDNKSTKRSEGTPKALPKARRVSEGLHITKSLGNVSKSKYVQQSDQSENAQSGHGGNGSSDVLFPSSDIGMDQSNSFQVERPSDPVLPSDSLDPTRALSLNGYDVPHDVGVGDYDSSCRQVDRRASPSSLWPDAPTTAPNFDDEIEAILASLDVDTFTNADYEIDNTSAASSTTAQRAHIPTHAHSDDENFDLGLDDEEFLMLTTDCNDGSVDTIDKLGTKASSSLRSGPTHMQDPPLTSRGPSGQFISPITQKTTRIIQKANDPNENLTPIVRPPFPKQVCDRSLVIGLSPNTLLRTCFRIGEAINAGRSAVRDGKNVIIELYARVLNSHRDETRQLFTFCDLYHVKPPHVNGVYDGAIWKAVELFNYDAGRLLHEHTMCRIIGKMKRDGQQWHLSVLNIWEATREDIAWTEGIVNS
ncbi:hypothetical protein BCR34DRAFT_574003 [Clohesyomyces aquaticus]|uniref:Uncharacterized protein n=1 Tax=Clohesyomyces aquaticus TaxID=1231657 RepID=A0A1Y1YXB4_9PLEO|nr:hypothetical protein BCR34DRAFT_574003 [Clohesyomyces aquaticus]